MTTTLSPPARRVLALGILVIVVALPYWLIVRPVLDRFAAVDTEIAEQQDMLQRYGSIAGRLGTLESRLAAIKRDGGSADDYLVGNSEAIVAAELQNRLKTVIAGADGKLASTQVLATTEEAGFRQITIRVRLNAGIEGLRRVLYELEAGRPLMFIDNLDVSSRQDRRRAGERETDPDLTVTFDVYGFMRPTP
ncbi:MAG: type II secretion system protein GspM [Rhodospirillales bacterium]|jgi:general secretion pathway protein M|nr:type II secretion system protein GspM [Rhodospirillales bacterium]